MKTVWILEFNTLMGVTHEVFLTKEAAISHAKGNFNGELSDEDEKEMVEALNEDEIWERDSGQFVAVHDARFNDEEQNP
jgi:hypothetical protein